MAGWQEILAQGIQDTNNILGSFMNNAWNQHNYEQDFNQRVNEFQANQIAQAQQFAYQQQQDALNREQQQQQINFNQNLANQQFNYQKSLQQQIFEREDNSIQRQIAGMRQAGLNPLSNSNSQANSSIVGSMGSAGSVSPVSSSAHISPVGSTGNQLPQIHFNPIDFLNQISNRDLLKAQADDLRAKTFNTSIVQKLMRDVYGENFERMSSEGKKALLDNILGGDFAKGFSTSKSEAEEGNIRQDTANKQSQKIYQDMVNSNYDKMVEKQLKDTQSQIEERVSNIALNAQKIKESDISMEQKQKQLESEIHKINAIVDLYIEIGKNYTAKTDLVNLQRNQSKMLFPAKMYKEYLSAIDNTINTIQDLIPSFNGLKGLLDNVKNKNNKLKNSLDSFDFSDLATDDDMKLFDDLLEAWK